MQLLVRYTTVTNENCMSLLFVYLGEKNAARIGESPLDGMDIGASISKLVGYDMLNVFFAVLPEGVVRTRVNWNPVRFKQLVNHRARRIYDGCSNLLHCLGKTS